MTSISRAARPRPMRYTYRKFPMADDTTTTGQAQSVPNRSVPLPGIVLVVERSAPAFRVVPFEGKPIVLGRGEGATLVIDDKRLSRAHVEMARDEYGWWVRDLGSHNGTRVDGVDIRAGQATRGALVRAGDSLVLLEDDIERFNHPHALLNPKRVVGPRLQQVLDLVGHAAQRGQHVLLLGESGVGKELVARAFHDASPFSAGPFRAVNCAALAEGVLEDELFGHVRGAYSGAVGDRPGLFESAHKGTLFLDEIGDMPSAVQAKVLRAIENGEVRRIGENDARHVRVQIISATNLALRDRVASGQFRGDLFHRVAQLVVEIPPLRARREEIPFLVAVALRSAGNPAAEASLYEQCLIRPWPGNVRELLGAVGAAVTVATAAKPPAGLRGRHLDPNAGVARPSASALAAMPTPSAPLVPSREAKEEAMAALAKQGLGVDDIAARVGVSTATVYRFLRRRPPDR